jgi:hypothetical protein
MGARPAIGDARRLTVVVEAVRLGPVPQEVRQPPQLGVAQPGGAIRAVRRVAVSSLIIRILDSFGGPTS